MAATAPGIVTFADFPDASSKAKSYFVQALPDPNGGWLGVIAVEIDLATFSHAFDAGFGATGRISLTAGDGRPRSVLRDVARPDNSEGERIVVSKPVSVMGGNWTLSGDRSLSEIEAPVREVQGAITATAILMILLSMAVMLVYIRRRLSTPLQAMTDSMSRLAAGDLSIKVPGLDRTDEIGEMARSVIVFRDAALDNRRLQADAQASRQRSESDRLAAEEAAIMAERQRVIGSIGGGLGHRSRR